MNIGEVKKEKKYKMQSTCGVTHDLLDYISTIEQYNQIIKLIEKNEKKKKMHNPFYPF